MNPLFCESRTFLNDTLTSYVALNCNKGVNQHSIFVSKLVPRLLRVASKDHLVETTYLFVSPASKGSRQGTLL